MNAESRAAFVARELARAPKLTEQQRARLAVLLGGS
jgi:hypothetical protein